MVPCKEGQLRVRELTQQALQRYLKTREKVSAARWACRQDWRKGARLLRGLPTSAPGPVHLPGALRPGGAVKETHNTQATIGHKLWLQL